MNEESIKELQAEADIAFKKRNFELAFKLSEILAKEDIPSALFTCGLIMEKGWIGGVKDLELAFSFYKDLSIKFNDDEGYLGCARIFLLDKDIENRDKAIAYCQGATSGRLKYLGFLLLGKIYEELYDPPNVYLARKFYLRAIMSGSAWALRQYAISLINSKNVIAGTLMHLVATIVSPIFVFFGGVRRSRNG